MTKISGGLKNPKIKKRFRGGDDSVKNSTLDSTKDGSQSPSLFSRAWTGIGSMLSGMSSLVSGTTSGLSSLVSNAASGLTANNTISPPKKTEVHIATEITPYKHWVDGTRVGVTSVYKNTGSTLKDSVKSADNFLFRIQKELLNNSQKNPEDVISSENLFKDSDTDNRVAVLYPLNDKRGGGGKKSKKKKRNVFIKKDI